MKLVPAIVVCVLAAFASVTYAPTASAQMTHRKLTGFFQFPTLCTSTDALRRLDFWKEQPDFNNKKISEIVAVYKNECRKPEINSLVFTSGFIIRQVGPEYTLIELIEVDFGGPSEKSRGVWWVKTSALQPYCTSKPCEVAH